MEQAVKYSFELNKDMLALLGSEFDVQELVSKFAEAIVGKADGDIELIAKEMFAEYGKNWILRSLKLGEEYPDRTYEVLKGAIDKTGGYYRFGLLPQRFIEIAYLSINNVRSIPIVECNAWRFAYKIKKCAIFKAIGEKCGENVAKLMSCRHICLTANEVLHKKLDIDAIVEMEAAMAKDGYCQFGVKRA